MERVIIPISLNKIFESKTLQNMHAMVVADNNVIVPHNCH